MIERVKNGSRGDIYGLQRVRVHEEQWYISFSFHKIHNGVKTVCLVLVTYWIFVESIHLNPEKQIAPIHGSKREEPE